MGCACIWIYKCVPLKRSMTIVSHFTMSNRNNNHPTHHHTARLGTVAHTEAALGTGIDYERPNEGENQWHDNVQDVFKERHSQPKRAQHESRGHRIDRELAEEDREEIAEKEKARQDR